MSISVDQASLWAKVAIDTTGAVVGKKISDVVGYVQNEVLNGYWTDGRSLPEGYALFAQDVQKAVRQFTDLQCPNEPGIKAAWGRGTSCCWNID